MKCITHDDVMNLMAELDRKDLTDAEYKLITSIKPTCTQLSDVQSALIENLRKKYAPQMNPDNWLSPQ